MKGVSVRTVAMLVVAGALLAAPLAAQDSNTQQWQSAGALEPVAELSVWEKEALANGILDRWAEEAGARGYSVDAWGDDLFGVLQRLDAQTLEAASKAASYRELIGLLGGRLLDSTQGSLEAAAYDDFAPQALGDNSDDLSFTPISPCRILDTRFGTGAWAGPFASGSTTAINTSLGNYASQGGLGATCPGQINDAGGLAFNITVVGYAGNGFATVFPYTAVRPNASTLNFGPGSSPDPIANGSVVQQCYICGPEISVYVEGTSTHVIIDVVGYYNPKPATTITSTRTADLALTGACQQLVTATLTNPSTYTRTVACEAVATPSIAHTQGTHDEIATLITTGSATCGTFDSAGAGFIDINAGVGSGCCWNPSTAAVATFSLGAGVTDTFYYNVDQVIPSTGGDSIINARLRCTLLP